MQQVHTDLALEARESVTEGKTGIPGVSVAEEVHRESGVRVTRVEVLNSIGARAIGKPRGIYITLETEAMARQSPGRQRALSEELSSYIKELLHSAGAPGSVLVVGLGNHEVTSDSLGPRTLEQIRITRHLGRKIECVKDTRQKLETDRKEGAHQEAYQEAHQEAEAEQERGLSGIVPGVMAQTGMETAEIVRGIVSETKPEAVVVIDALAARSVSRLANTIQLSNTGIRPGSGVGNHRHSLTEESLGCPVIAIGVPTVVAAAAIVYDTVDALAELLRAAGSGNQAEAVEDMTMEERYQMVRELIEPRLGPMYVTPGNIDEQIKNLSFLIAEGINLAFQS
ncbi:MULTISPECIES: GPR endopeptidase [unclassified Candidatus Paralachnospira]|uniref:GPR endopeptidase n=1 Tax=unclassified Candidatus Paralachnospira TaxID=3099471 RepID=UPI003F8DC24D